MNKCGHERCNLVVLAKTPERWVKSNKPKMQQKRYAHNGLLTVRFLVVLPKRAHVPFLKV